MQAIRACDHLSFHPVDADDADAPLRHDADDLADTGDGDDGRQDDVDKVTNNNNSEKLTMMTMMMNMKMMTTKIALNYDVISAPPRSL